MKNKLTVALIFGGRSQEHAASVMSAQDMFKALKGDAAIKFVPIYITQAGQWFSGESIVKGEKKLAKGAARVELKLNGQREFVFVKGNIKKSVKVDAALPWVLGPYGEDGNLPGLLVMANIPYVGSPVFAAATGFNKLTTKRYCDSLGIAQVPARAFSRTEWKANPALVTKKIKTFKFPCFIKPASCGSSIGVSKVKNNNGIKTAMTEAFKYDQTVLVEQAVPNAIEAECAVIGNDVVKVSVPGQVEYDGDFYSYHAKYVAKKWGVKIPPALPSKTIKQVQAMAQKVFVGLGAAGLARVDFLVNPKTKQVFFNEINTYPTFRAESMVTRLLATIGVSYGAAIKQLVFLAIKRHQSESARELNFRANIKGIHL